MSLCGFTTCENTVYQIKMICGKHAGISSQIPDPFLLNFSCPFDPPDTLSYWSTVQRSNPIAVNGNLGIILHAAREMWKAGHSDWFSNNWEIWDKCRNIYVLITRVVADITSHQFMCGSVTKKAIKHVKKKRESERDMRTVVLWLCQWWVKIAKGFKWPVLNYHWVNYKHIYILVSCLQHATWHNANIWNWDEWSKTVWGRAASWVTPVC